MEKRERKRGGKGLERRKVLKSFQCEIEAHPGFERLRMFDSECLNVDVCVNVTHINIQAF